MTETFFPAGISFHTHTAGHPGELAPFEGEVGKINSEERASILFISEDVELANMSQTFLRYDHHNVVVVDGMAYGSQLEASRWDLIILDWQLSGMSGVEICRKYRDELGQLPILMLTPRESVAATLTALDIGADSCLAKPFDMRELSARVRALLRRPAEILPINCLSVGSISLEISTRRVTREGSPVALLPKEFQLFEFLMRHPNQVLTAETLIKRVFPTHSSTVESFRVTMKRLRKKIDPESIHLRNIHGVGYILTAD